MPHRHPMRKTNALKKRIKTVSIFKSLKNVILCHDSKGLQLCGNQFSLSKVSLSHTHTHHITRKTQSFMGCGEEKCREKRVKYFISFLYPLPLSPQRCPLGAPNSCSENGLRDSTHLLLGIVSIRCIMTL